MANEFIIRKGYKSLEDSQITGSLSLTGAITGSTFSGSFVGDGSQLSGVSAGFPYTGSATISGSLEVTGSVTATSFIGDGSQLTGIADPTPITATINNTNSPFTVTSQSIVIIDSTNGDVTVNLPDLDAIVGTSDQRTILIYKNDYSQNVIYVQPSGSQLVNGTTQDIIVSIQIAIAYNPTSAGWVTEGTSYQSLAELEMFFVPRTETGSLSVATASYVEYANVANKPTLISGSSQVTYSGLTGIPSGIVSGSAQVASFGIFATTGSNQFNGNQSITGSLTVSGQVVAQTLNVQQVTSSIVYSSGSNIFGNSLANTQQFTGSVSVTGSFAVTTTGTELQVTNTGVNIGNISTDNHNVTGSLRVSGSMAVTGAGTFSSSMTAGGIISTSGTGLLASVRINNTTTSTGKDWHLYSLNNGNFGLFNNTDGSYAYQVTPSGNLGLGVTPSAWGTIKALQVFNGSFSGSPNNNIVYQFGNAYYDGSSFRYVASDFAAQYRLNNDGGHAWYIAPSGTAGNAISFTQAMTLDASGRLGIGTTSPQSWTRLEVAGTAGAQIDAAQQVIIAAPTTTVGHGAGLRFNAASGAKEAVGIIGVVNESSGNLGAMTFHTYGGGGNIPERMRITSGGNILINQTSALLGVSPTIEMSGVGAASPTSQASYNVYAWHGTNSTWRGYLQFVKSRGSTIGSYTVVANGDDLGTIRWSGADGSGTVIGAEINAYVDGTPGVNDMPTRLAFLTTADGASEPTERMRITSGGQVFINQSNNIASARFEVSSNSSTSSFAASLNGGGSTTNVLNIYTPGNRSSDTTYTSIQIGDDNAVRFRIFANGNVQNTNGSYGSISDAKLKENIEDATPKLDDLMKVKVRNYNLIGDDKKQIGVIAQELEEVFPAMIDESEDFEDVEVPQVDEEGNEILNEEGEVVTTKERVSKGTTTKSVKYSVFVPMLIKAIQEQQAQIEILKAEIQTLKQ